METFKTKEAEQDAIVAKYSAAILKMEEEINRVKAENNGLLAQISKMATDVQGAKLETETATMMNSQLQKLLTAEKSMSNSHKCNEPELRVELSRLEAEKADLHAQVNRLESNLQMQLQRETELKKNQRERDLKAEDERSTFAFQIQARNKAIEEILVLQGQQQTEIRQLQIKVDEARRQAEEIEKSKTTELLKTQVDRIELEKRHLLSEEAHQAEKERFNQEIHHLLRDLESERERSGKEARELKLLQAEHKKLKKEFADQFVKIEKLNSELESKTAQNQSQLDHFQSLEEKQRQKDKVSQAEVDFLKEQVTKIGREKDELVEEVRRQLEIELADKMRTIENLQTKVRTDQLENQARQRVVEAERDELRNRLLVAEKKALKCVKCEESGTKRIPLSSERVRTEFERAKAPSLADRSTSDADHNAEMINKYKEKIRTLRAKNDELNNENQFFESKIEKLEKRLIDMIYGDTVEKRAAEEAERLRQEVKREVTRAEQQK